MARSKQNPSRRATRSQRRDSTHTEPVAPASAAIVVEDLRFTYPDSHTPALAGVSFSVAAGEFVYLVGSSGSGKSSLLRALYAETRPDSGRLRVAGTNLMRMRPSRVPAYRRSLGVVFQDFKLLEGRTVHEQIAFALTVLGRRKQAPALVPHVLDLVGLADKADRIPTELSGGEQQRVAIARALVTSPVVLIADEPTGNLDPVTASSVLEVLERINQAGTTVVMATHDQNLVNDTGHRVIALAGGQVVRDDVSGGYHTEDLREVTEAPAPEQDRR